MTLACARATASRYYAFECADFMTEGSLPLFGPAFGRLQGDPLGRAGLAIGRTTSANGSRRIVPRC
jgi:hypothetical protein